MKWTPLQEHLQDITVMLEQIKQSTNVARKMMHT
jgi:hypothetical protein